MEHARSLVFVCLLLTSLLPGVTSGEAPNDHLVTRGSTYYVHANATGASDGNDGLSKDHTGGTNGPWATLTQAINTVQAGDTVLVYDGVYQGGFQIRTGGTKALPIVFKAMTEDHLIDATGYSLGILVHNPSVRIGYVTVEGFRIKGATTSDIDVSRADNITLRNNTLWGTKMGMNVVFSSYTTVENNTAFGNSEHGVYFSGGSGGTSSYCTVRNNTFRGNGWTGIQLRTGSTAADPYIHHCVVENNTIHGNGWDGAAGITLSHVRHSVVRNNLLYDNLAGGFVVWGGGGFIGPRNVTIVSNTVYFEPGVGRPAFNLKNGCQDITLKNNILIGGNDVAFSYTSESLQGLDMDNNVLYRHGSDNIIFNESSSTSYNLTEWRAVEPAYNTNSMEASHTELFEDASNDDLHLKAGSPAIDAGDSSVPGIPVRDMEGNPRMDDPDTTNTGTGPLKYFDIGALEFVVTTLPDLSVAPSDMSFNVTAPFEGDTIEIMVEVHNIGDAPAQDVDVAFFADDLSGSPATLIDNVSVDIEMGASSGGGASVSWQTTHGMNGTYNITVKVDGGQVIPELREDNNVVSKTITLLPKDIDPPHVTLVSPVNGSKDVPVDTNITVRFNEDMEDGVQAQDVLGISPAVTGSFEWPDNRTIRFVPSSGLGYGTTYTATVGTTAVDISGNGLPVEHTWTFTTEPRPNTGPVLVPTPIDLKVLMYENQSLRFSVSVQDDDPANLTFEWYMDHGLRNGSGDNMTYEAGFDDAGEHDLNLTVYDHGIPSFMETVIWEITVLDVNRPPVIVSSEPGRHVWEDERVNGLVYLTIDAMDPDGDLLTYVWSVDGEAKNGSDRDEFWFAFDYLSAGVHEILVVVSDGKDNVGLNWTITISNTNRRPTLDLYEPTGDVSINDTTNMTFSVTVSDQDADDTVRVEWYVDNVSVIEGGTFVYRPFKGENSTRTIRMVAKDGKGGEVSKEWKLEVRPAADGPSPPKKDPDRDGGDMTMLYAGVILGAIIAIVIIAILLLKRRNGKRVEGPGSSPGPPEVPEAGPGPADGHTEAGKE